MFLLRGIRLTIVGILIGLPLGVAGLYSFLAKIDGLEIVASGPTQSAPGKPNGGTYTGTVYPGPSGNVVFNAATCWWADGLSAPPGYVRPKVYTAPQGPDGRLQRITTNVLRRMIRRA